MWFSIFFTKLGIIYFVVLHCSAEERGQETEPSSQDNRAPAQTTLRLQMTDRAEIPKNFLKDSPKTLDTLHITKNKIKRILKSDFPDGCCPELSYINLHDNYISYIEDGVFESLPKLVTIDLSDNMLTKFPNLTAKNLQKIELQTNLIESIDEEAMKYYKNLWHLDVGFNRIKRLKAGTFKENDQLLFLQLRNNPLEFIEDGGLPDSVENLHLDNTMLSALPSKGIGNIKKLTVKNVPNMFTIPDPSEFKKLEKVEFTYNMHCCPFMERKKIDDLINDEDFKLCNATPGFDLNDPGQFTDNNSTNDNSTQDQNSHHLADFDPFNSLEDSADFGPFDSDLDMDTNMSLCQFIIPNEDFTYKQSRISIKCTPKPDAFHPCQDVMGTHVLRAFSWIISTFAVFGNLFQLIILFYSRQELSVYKLLMYNLGFANFLMGMYLLVLCCVDTYTYGKYYNYVQSWQYSGGCQAFGFIAMFATQLSFCTLVLITVERFLLIIYALQVGNQMKLRHAIVAVFLIWVYSFVVAILPVTGKVSSYSKIAICLPVDIPTKVAMGYIVWLLLAYIIAFFIIVGCYVKMYFSISKVRPGSTGNTIDIQVAKRMAMIIFSNFLCWLPISIAGFIALYSSIKLNVDVAKFLLVFIFPLNACTNPFLYAIFTKVFRGDTLALLSSCGLCRKAEANYRNRAPSSYQRSKQKSRADTNNKHFMHYQPPSESSKFFGRHSNIESQTEFDSPETPIKVMIDPNRSRSQPSAPLSLGDTKVRSDSQRGLLEDTKPLDPRFRSESNDTCSTGMSVQSTDSEVYEEFSRMIGSVKSENYLA